MLFTFGKTCEIKQKLVEINTEAAIKLKGVLIDICSLNFKDQE